MQEIRLYKSPWKAIRIILLAAPFIAFSAYSIIDHKNNIPTYPAWLCLCFFGLAIPIGLFQLFDKRPQIIINENGIFDRMAYKDFINWKLIRDAYAVNVHGQKFICLVIDEAAIPLLKSSKRMIKISKELGFQEINLSLGQLKSFDVLKFIDFIKQMALASPAVRETLLQIRSKEL